MDSAAPDFEAIAADVYGLVRLGDMVSGSNVGTLQAEIAYQLQVAYIAGQNSVATPALQQLAGTAILYTAVHAQPGTTKPTTATERAIDTLCAAARRLAEEQ